MPDDTRTNESDQRPVVVGMGASAGGLDALMRMFGGMPERPPMCFVIVQHLDPTHESALSEILQRKTTLNVAEVSDDVQIADGNVYVIPPGKYISIEGCVLKLSEPSEPRGSRMAVDHFLRSLAEDACEYAIGVILSGTGTDGTAGLKEIKQYGGLTVVQEPRDAEHSGMPQSAIDSVSVDYVLPAEEIAGRIINYVNHARQHGLLAAQDSIQSRDQLASIVALLRERTGTDFRRYRKSTIARRIRRRMGLAQLVSMQDYLLYLRDTPQECLTLQSDLLIGVTQFFRNPEAWKKLESRILQPLVESSRAEKPIRIWCAGCATGEEVYSLAMLCHENAAVVDKQAAFQIFATDVSSKALETAREGLYPESVVSDVSRTRLQQFFHKEGHYYQVARRLRESIVFAEQNVLAHPPFSQLDLIVCRNMLIYLEKSAQQRVLNVFQFALKEGGGLFLGSSESTGDCSQDFDVVHKRWRLFRRSGTATTVPVERDAIENRLVTSDQAESSPAKQHGNSFATLVQRQLVRESEIGIAVINSENQAVYVQGPIDLYFQMVTGELGGAAPSVLNIAREGLRSKLRELLRVVRKTATTVQVDGRVRREGQYRKLRIIGRPLRGHEETVLLSFVPASSDSDHLSSQDDSPITEEVATKFDNEESAFEASQAQIRELEHELDTTRQQLSSTIEDLETANEELQAANEESMSVNEELQAGNEELETTKEELQSLNEELVTLNNQLELKLHQLQETTDDLNNLFHSTHLPTVFVDTHFRIRRFTPSATELFHLIASDTGRLISDIRADFDIDELFALARQVLDDLQPQEFSVETADGQSYIGRVQPYRTEDDHIRGVVMTFSNVTALRNSERLAQARLSELQTIYESTPTGMSFIDRNWRYRSINKQLAEINGVTVKDTVGKTLREVVPDPLCTEVEVAYQQVFDTGEPIDKIEVTGRTAASNEDRHYRVSYHPVRSDSDEIIGVNSVVEDVTDAKRMAMELADREAHLRRVIDNMLNFVGVLDHEGVMLEVNQTALDAAGITRADVIGKPFWECYWWNFDDDRVTELRDVIKKAQQGEISRYDTTVRMAGDTRMTIDFMLVPVTDDDGTVTHIIPSGVDISDRKTAERQLQKSEELTRTMAENSTHALVMMDDQGYMISCNHIFMEMTGFSEEELKAAPLHDVIHHHYPDGRPYPMSECPIDRALPEDNSVRAHEDLFFRKDGSSFPVQCAASPIFADGRPVSTVIEVQDITERKAAEAELVAKEAHLRRVINNQLGLVGLIDREGKLVEVDDRSLAIAKTKREDVIGKHFAEAPWWNYDPAVQRQMRDAMERAFAGEVVRYDVSLFSSGDDGVMIDFMIAPVKGDQGEVEFLIPSGVDVGDRKRFEEELEESRNRLNMALQAGGMAAWEWTPEGSVWPRELFEMIGVDSDREASPETFFTAVHRDDVDDLKDAWDRAIEGDGRYDQLFRIVRPNGEHRWIRGVGEVVRDEAGSAQRIYGLNWDETETHLAIEALAESRQRLALAMKSARMGSFLWNRGTDETIWDTEWCDAIGLPHDVERSGETFFQLVHPDDLAELMEVTNQSLHGKRDYKHEFRIIRPNGEVRWLAAVGNWIDEPDGPPLRLTGLNWDITEQKEVESALRLNEERLKIAAGAAGFGTFHLDLDRQEVHWSDEMKHLIGLPSDSQPIPQIGVVPEFIHSADRDKVKSFLDTVLADHDEPDHAHEHRIVRPDGDLRHVRMQCRSLFEQNGSEKRIRLIIGTLLDITQQREYQKSLEKQRRMAEAANQSKSEFLANMSHEIRTPMTAILGYAEILQELVTGDEAQKHLQTIRRNGSFLLDIINDILDLSKIEADKLEIGSEPFSPARLVEDVRSIMEVRASGSGLQLTVDYRGQIPAIVYSDPKRLKQILINLIGNAIKFTKKGSVEIVVEFLPDTDAPLKFSIIDSGIGMSAEQQGKLFKPFSQADASVTREFGGTGLGLVISRRLAEMLGGEITVESELGGGSTFTLTIAVGDLTGIEHVEPETVSQQSPTSQHDELPALDCHVLLVDDRRDVRFLSKRILSKAGATITETTDGLLAIEAVEKARAEGRHFDLILLDMQMPNLDGYTTAKRLREMGFDKPIIALTADAMQGDMKECINAGCDDYLSKPIAADLLVTKVAQLMQRPKIT